MYWKNALQISFGHFFDSFVFNFGLKIKLAVLVVLAVVRLVERVFKCVFIVTLFVVSITYVNNNTLCELDMNHMIECLL